MAQPTQHWMPNPKWDIERLQHDRQQHYNRMTAAKRTIEGLNAAPESPEYIKYPKDETKRQAWIGHCVEEIEKRKEVIAAFDAVLKAKLQERENLRDAAVADSVSS
jgi:hypothetical protein